MNCPSLDTLCGGGVPHESLVYIYGGAGLGKTTIALNMLRAMGSGVWVDCGYSLVESYARVEGQYEVGSEDNITVVFPTATPNIDNLLPLIGVTPLLVIDDITALSDKLAAPLEAFIKEAKALLPGSGTTLLITNQVRHCRNGYLPPGGLSYTKYADLVLELGPYHRRVGDRLRVKARIVRSTVGPCQGSRLIPFRYGLDREYDILTTAVGVGVIQQAGSWYTYRDIKVQGLEQLEYSLTGDTIYKIYEEVMHEVSSS